MTIQFFTFGGGHIHPQTGESLAHQYVAIHMPPDAPADAHRARMFRFFGPEWSHQYDALPDAVTGPCAQFPVDKYDRAKLGPEICAWMDANDPDMAPYIPEPSE